MFGKKIVELVPSKIELLVPNDVAYMRHLHFGEIFKEKKTESSFSDDLKLRISFEYLEKKKFLEDHFHLLQFFSKDVFFKENKAIFYKKMGHLYLGVGIEKINDFEYNFFCTEHYKKFVIEKIGTLFPVGIHISDLIQTVLLQSGALAFYGASFFNVDKNDASLIMAPAGIGKTCSLLKLVNNHSRYKILGEEITFVEFEKTEPIVHATPNTSYTNINKHVSSLSWRNLFLSREMKSLSSVYSSDYFASSGLLNRIYILEFSKNEGVKQLKFEEAYRKVSTIQETLFSYSSNPLLRPFFYRGLFSSSDIESFKKSCFERIISFSKVYSVSASEVGKFSDYINRIEDR